MKLKNLIDGLSECINDYVEGELDPDTEQMLEKYLERDIRLGFFVYQTTQGKSALKDAYQVKAAEDFEEKLAKRIADEKYQEA